MAEPFKRGQMPRSHSDIVDRGELPSVQCIELMAGGMK